MPSRIYSLIAILCLLAAGTVWSQDTKGTITGRVTDPSGSVIRRSPSRSHQHRHGNQVGPHHQCRGHLSRAALRPACTRSKSLRSGFKKAVRNAVEVRVADRLDINIALEIGASEQ